MFYTPRVTEPSSQSKYTIEQTEESLLPTYSSQDFSNLDMTPGNKFRVKNGILSVDKRLGIQRFFTRDGRTKTLEFLKKHKGEMSPMQTMNMVRCLLETYKNDNKYCEEVLELL